MPHEPDNAPCQHACPNQKTVYFRGQRIHKPGYRRQVQNARQHNQRDQDQPCLAIAIFPGHDQEKNNQGPNGQAAEIIIPVPLQKNGLADACASFRNFPGSHNTRCGPITDNRRYSPRVRANAASAKTEGPGGDFLAAFIVNGYLRRYCTRCIRIWRAGVAQVVIQCKHAALACYSNFRCLRRSDR